MCLCVLVPYGQQAKLLLATEQMMTILASGESIG